jgi:hypothetical protein
MLTWKVDVCTLHPQNRCNFFFLPEREMHATAGETLTDYHARANRLGIGVLLTDRL